MDDNFENDREIERRWLEREIGENYRLSETFQEIFKEEKEIERLRIAERERNLKAQSRELSKNKSNFNEPNYLNSHPYWGQPFAPLPFLFRVIEWLSRKKAPKTIRRKLGKKNRD